ncbi:hypothetical protein BKA69DRAFT_848669 [Paraphysoderma sedebokerense]|nr:hypothetical protein BKA69DRAFT_848669 [Paraphysoderma sedebokerense]
MDNLLFLSVESSEIVESVHFDGLVNELAIVHTIGCEGFYVLRYTGNVIGTVDDGISLLYQRLLNCTEAGKPVSRNVRVDEPGDCDNLWKEYFNGGLRGEV